MYYYAEFLTRAFNSIIPGIESGENLIQSIMINLFITHN